MEANLNAIVMILFAGGTAVACVVLCRKRPSLRRAALALLGGAAVALACFTVFVHLCREGQPVMQAVVCGACLAAIWIFVTGGLARWVGTVTLVAGCIALCMQYNDLVHRPEYTGTTAHVDDTGATPRPRALWHSRLTRLYAVDVTESGAAGSD